MQKTAKSRLAITEVGGFYWTALLLVLALLASRQQLTGTVQQLLLPLTHLNRVDGVIGGDLLDRLATTDRLHGDSGLEFGTVGAALAHEWDPPFQGRYPASEVNDGSCPEKPDHLTPEVIQRCIDKTNSLLKEIHQSMVPTMEYIFDPKKAGDENFNPFRDVIALREAIFYTRSHRHL